MSLDNWVWVGLAVYAIYISYQIGFDRGERYMASLIRNNNEAGKNNHKYKTWKERK